MALPVEADLGRELVHELGPLGPRSDQTHLSSQHVPELWQLVEPAAAEKTADAIDAVVVLAAPDGARRRLGVLAHRAEFVNGELTPLKADAALVIENRSGRSELHEHGDHGHDRRRQDQADSRSDQVEHSLFGAQQPRLPKAGREDEPARTQVLDRNLSRVLFVHGREMVERHPAVEAHREQRVHRQPAARVGQTDHHPVDMEPLCELAARHGLFLVEDAAEAHGAEYRGRRVGGHDPGDPGRPAGGGG